MKGQQVKNIMTKDIPIVLTTLMWNNYYNKTKLKIEFYIYILHCKNVKYLWSSMQECKKKMWKFDKCIVMNIFMEFGNLILHIKFKIAIIIKSNKFVVIVNYIKRLFKVIFQYKVGCNYWRNWYLIGELS